MYRTVLEDYPPAGGFSTEVFEQALTKRPTILFFHGNVSLYKWSRHIAMTELIR